MNAGLCPFPLRKPLSGPSKADRDNIVPDPEIEKRKGGGIAAASADRRLSEGFPD